MHGAPLLRCLVELRQVFLRCKAEGACVNARARVCVYVGLCE